MKEYLIYDRDKAAFINRMNKFLKQLNPKITVNSDSFIDIPGEGEQDLTIYKTGTPEEGQILNTLLKNKMFNFKVKPISLKEIVSKIKE